MHKNKEILLQYIKDRIVIDVGSYQGEFVDFCMSASEKIKQFILFEPQKSSYEFLKKKYPNDIQIYNMALGDQSGEVNFYSNLDGYKSSLLEISEYFDDKVTCEKITVQKLDNLSLTNDSYFLKIDTQGHDLAVLNGARHFIEQNKPVIYCELTFTDTYKSQCRPFEIIGYLESLGYRLVKLDNLVETTNILSYCDALFIHVEDFEYQPNYLKQFDHYHTETQDIQIDILSAVCDERLNLINRLDNELKRKK